MNAEGAESALAIARRSYDSGETDKALRFVKKSISLHSTPAALALLAKLESGTRSASSSARAPPATNPATRPAAATRKPSEHEPAKREYTPDQVAMVKRVRACRVTESVDGRNRWQMAGRGRVGFPARAGEATNGALFYSQLLCYLGRRERLR